MASSLSDRSSSLENSKAGGAVTMTDFQISSGFLFPGVKVKIRALLFLTAGLRLQAAAQCLPQAIQNQSQTESWEWKL